MPASPEIAAASRHATRRHWYFTIVLPLSCIAIAALAVFAVTTMPNDRMPPTGAGLVAALVALGWTALLGVAAVVA